MATRKPKAKPPNAIDVTIGGEGISPASVNARSLAELLQAMSSAVAAVAKTIGVEAPSLSLAAITVGSAKYAFVSESEQAAEVFAKVYDFAKERAKRATPEVRHALERLHGEVSKIGTLGLSVRASSVRSSRAAITIAAPLHGEGSGLESYAEIHGHLVGLYVWKSGAIEVRVRLDEGHTETFSGDASLLASAKLLFNQPVRARVVYSHDLDIMTPRTIERVDSWASSGHDFVDAADAFRKELQAEGVEIDSAAWLADLRDDG